MRRMSVGVFLVAAGMSCAAFSFQLDPLGVGERKIILAGWEFNNLRPEDFLSNAEKLDKTPADGFVVPILENPAVGRNFGTMTLMTEPLWKDELLEDLVPQFREMTKHRSMRHCFLKGLKVPTNVRLDWRDDKAWAVAASNVSAVARLARKSGFRGIQMDVEDYWRKRQFFRIETDPPTPDLRKIVRQRGRQVFSAVFNAYPDITVLSYFGVSAIFFMQEDRMAQSLALAKRDLLTAFMNGMLDVMPPTARFVEGIENAYKFDYAKKDFLTARTRIYNWYLPLIAPENRLKYLSQVATGFGLYLDMYINKKGGDWYFGDIDGSRLEYLRRNAAQALSATDEYIWFWGECGMWIDWSEKTMKRIQRTARTKCWSELIPGGLNECLLILKDPRGHLLPRIEKAIADGVVTNIISNPFCKIPNAAVASSDPLPVPSPFLTWQREPKKGIEKSIIAADPAVGDGDANSVFIKGVNGGCVHFNLQPVKPGSYFYVSASVKGDGAWPFMNFMSGKTWLDDRIFLPIEGECATSWRTIRACVRVPDAATMLSLTFGVSNLGPSETVWYDNICLYELPEQLVTGMEK